MTVRSVYVLALSFLLASALCADEVILKSGIALKGHVVERNGRHVVIVSGGRRMIYKAADVVAVKLDPLPEFEEGKSRLVKGNVSAAVRAFEGVLSGKRVLFQEDARAKLVFCYFRTGRPVDAVAMFLEMLRNAPESRHRLCFPWQYEGKLGDVSRIAKFIAGSRSSVSFAPALEAWVSLVLGNATEAERKISSLLRHKDSVVRDVGVILQLRMLFQAKKRKECTTLAAKEARGARETVRPWAHYWQGRCLMAEKDYPRAALALLRVPTLYPRSECLAGDSLYLVGQCFEKMGSKDRAKKEYAALASQFPIALAADQARKRAAALK